MKYTYAEKRITITDDLKKYAEKKIGKLDRLFRGEGDAYVTFSTERGRFLAEITIRNNGMIYRASEVTNDMFASIDSGVAAIERQVRKNKTRLAKRLREGALETDPVPDFASAEDFLDEEEEFKIVRTKRVPMRPMSPEEAILQMNLLGHSFFVFRDAEDDSVSVVYARKNGGYGLIVDEDR